MPNGTIVKPPEQPFTGGTYTFDFSEDQWEELTAMSFEPFEFGEGDALTRGQWMALGHMALGKAQRIEEGAYDGPEVAMDDDEGDGGFNSKKWAEDLRAIAEVIFTFFQPADGKI